MRERLNFITLAYWRLVPFTLSSTVTMVVLHEFHKFARTVWIDVCCTCFVVLADGEHRGNSSTRVWLGEFVLIRAIRVVPSAAFGLGGRVRPRERGRRRCQKDGVKNMNRSSTVLLVPFAAASSL